MPFKSRRFWMLIVGGVLGAVGVHSEGSRPMGDR